MTTPSGPILGAVHLNDGVNSKFDWNRATGLSDTSQVGTGSIQQTFDGPFRVTPRLQTRAQRDVLLTGYIIHSGGLAEGWSRLLSVQQLVSAPLAVLQVGGLGLEVAPQTIRPERLKAMQGSTLDYTSTVTAVPGNWRAMYGYAEGSAYGMTVNGETLNHTNGNSTRTLDAFALAAGNAPAVTNLGTAPTPLVLTISVSGPRTTRFYVRCTAPGFTRRISITPVNGVATITEDMGLFVPAGTSYLRYEESSGALIAGTIASSIYGTRWRWDGLATAESTRALPIVYNTRQTRAYYANAAFTASSGLRTAHPDQPRFGNSGTYSATTAGLLVEPDRTNLVLQSQAIDNASWATGGAGVAVVADTTTAPDGSNTADQITTTIATYGDRRQTITVSNTSVYVASVYCRAGAAGAASRLIVADGGGSTLASTEFTPGANWARYTVIFTTISTSISLRLASPSGGATSDNYWWGAQVELATGQTAANATSYIPTTSTTQTRRQDIVGVRRLENLVAWSNRFDKTTAVSGTRGLWYVNGAAITTSTRQVGPSGVTDAASGVFAAGQYIEQALLNAENLSGKTVEISIWVRNSTSTPNSQLTLRLTDSAGFTEFDINDLTDDWRRITIQRALGANITAVYLNLRGRGAVTAYFAHAQATVVADGAYLLTGTTNNANSISVPYVETQGIPYSAEGTWTYPRWLVQNGYIEADICFGETANPNLGDRVIIGANSNTTLTPSMHQGFIRRSSVTGSASNDIGFGKQNNNGTTAGSWVPASTYYDGAYRKYRLEWVNYLMAGVRTLRLYLYIDGTAVANATTSGATAWLEPPTLEIINGGGCWQTMRNLVIGSPTLPTGAVPQPY
jgi:hypothetical protein